ncbi:DUF3223 domain-containing protein [Nitratireductor aquimarinus]|uniref:DUF3223 domain-containing protein n=1 Tax=Nitratireductor aquimarinus TaxID=889300 RepID=UPI00398F76D4
MKVTVVIGGLTFPSKRDAIEYYKNVLNRYEDGAEIAGVDASAIEALLYARPDKVAEMAGRKVVRYRRKMHRHNTPCFFAELDDGKLLDISYMKFINSYPQSTGA